MFSMILLIVLLVIYAAAAISSMRHSDNLLIGAISDYALAALWAGFVVTYILEDAASSTWFLWLHTILGALLVVLCVISGIRKLRRR